MKKAALLSVVSLSLILPASFAQTPPPPKEAPHTTGHGVSEDAPPEIQEAKQKLESAKADLNHSGEEWGGFRSKAITNINEAIENLNKALQYRQNKMKK